MACLLALGSLLAPLQLAAAADPIADYTADAIEAQGVSTIQGTLGAINLDGLNVSSISRMEIAAPQGFRIERHWQSNPLSAWEENDPNQELWAETHRSSWVRTAAYRPYYSMFIAPMSDDRPSLEVRSKDSWDLRPSENTSAEQPAFFSPEKRNLVVADVAGSQQLVDRTGGRDITVTGNFVAVFFEWDIYLDSTDVAPAKRYVPSGVNYTSPSPLVPAQAAMLAGSSHYNQTYVVVQGGELRLTVEDPKWNAVYLYAQEFGVDGSLALRGAMPIEHGLDALPEDKGFRGTFRASIEPDGAHRIAVHFQTTGLDSSAVQDVPVDAVQLEPSDGTVAPGRPNTGAFLLGMGIAVGVAAVLLVARALVNMARFRRLEGLMDDQQYSAVTAESGPLLRTWRYGATVGFMHAVALLNTGRAADASAFLGDLSGRRQPGPSAMAYLQACAAVLQHRRDEAALLLKNCLEMDASFAAETRANPWFAALLGHPFLTTWFAATDPDGSYA